MQRRTVQREAIRRAIEQADRPLLPNEILEAASQALPGLGIATVYRTINAGVEDGWLKPVELPGSNTHYEMAGKKHHHHFECTQCGGVYEVDGCPGNLQPLAPDGFKLEAHELVLYGLCETCNA